MWVFFTITLDIIGDMCFFFQFLLNKVQTEHCLKVLMMRFYYSLTRALSPTCIQPLFFSTSFFFAVLKLILQTSQNYKKQEGHITQFITSLLLFCISKNNCIYIYIYLNSFHWQLAYIEHVQTLQLHSYLIYYIVLSLSNCLIIYRIFLLVLHWQYVGIC